MAEVFIGADHRGFSIKERLVSEWEKILTAKSQSDISHTPLSHPEQFQLIDLGPTTYDAEDDFNDAAINVARQITERAKIAQSDREDHLINDTTHTITTYGILICGSAHGIAMQANRFRGIRAICGYTEELAILGRQHNDANVLCLSADFMDITTINAVIRAFLATDFLVKERFIRRNRRLDDIIQGETS